LVSNGINLGGPLYPQIIVSLVVVKCVKHDEYNDWLMLAILTMYPIAIWDPMLTPKLITSYLP
jgi:hypothetical protein